MATPGAAPGPASSGDGPPTPSTLDELGSAASLLRGLAHAPGGDGLLVAGDVVADQYRVERALGEGGMGVVYLARDLRLGRAVALKLGRALAAGALARVEREAAALARLTHPNVVVVHQVGSHRGRVFIAMEHVAGGTARRWCAERPRTWREIVALYAAAGDGLAAAHDAGIVHRDFKPDNVLVGADGRPRVADFGLARALGAPGDARDRDDDAGDGGDDDADAPTAPDGRARGRAAADSPPALASMTRTGVVLGTPAYMPPEQRDGADVDARADQFAFCAALWEALFGARPWTGATPDAVRAAIEAEPPRPPAGARRVPRHVVVALRRGLRPDAAARWPAMAPLLAELRRDPARRRRNALYATAAVAAVAAAVLVPYALTAPRPDPCAVGEQEMTARWNPAAAGLLRAAFGGVRQDWAAAAGDRVARAFDDWSARWSVSYRHVCEASDAAWSPALREQAMQCLARRRQTFTATLAVLERVDATVAAKADDLIGDLPSPDACDDQSLVAKGGRALPDPAKARAADALDGAVARAVAFGETGRVQISCAIATPAGVVARTLGAVAVGSQASTQCGWALSEVGAPSSVGVLEQAYADARAGDDLGASARAANLLADHALSHRLIDLAYTWSVVAFADASAVGDVHARAHATMDLSMVSLDRAQLKEALALATDGVNAALESKDARLIAYALFNRAQIYEDDGQPGLELADLRDARDRATRAFGPDHPFMLTLDARLGYALNERGLRDEAIAIERAADAIGTTNLTADTKRPLADLDNALGGTLVNAGRHADALPYLDRAYALYFELDGPLGAELASTLNNRGLAYSGLERYDAALADYRYAVAIAASPFDDDPKVLGAAATGIARIHLARRQGREALAAAERATAAAVRLDPTTPDAAYAFLAKGEALEDLGQLAAAREAFEHGLALRDRPGLDPIPGAQLDEQLAYLLGDLHDARACAYEAAAVQLYTDGHDGRADRARQHGVELRCP